MGGLLSAHTGLVSHEERCACTVKMGERWSRSPGGRSGPADRLPHFEPLELRMVKVERFVVTGPMMGSPKRVRFRPRLEGVPALPQRMRGIEGVFIRLWTPEEFELDKTWCVREVAIAVEPDLLKSSFGSLSYPEAIHGDEH
jgi:hypothetical protein